MAAYAYSAINAEGLELAGEVHAPDLDAAREQLRIRGLLAERLEELPASGEDGARTVFKKIKPKTLQIFSRQFATMIEAGLNVVAALVILEEQTEDKDFATVVPELRADVEGRLLLSQAMRPPRKISDRLFISMVEAGEAAGILDQVLDRVAFQIEKATQIKRRVKGAMLYPTMVLIFATLVLIGMIIFPVFIGLIFAVRKYKKTEPGRQLWDRIKLRIPMKIGDVVLKVTMARFSRTLSTLVAAGADIIKAHEITGQTSGNWVVEDALANVRARVHEGVPIAQPLVENEIFPPMVSQMVKIGEETGELEKMLSKIADFYEDEVDTAIASLTAIIEPLMMIGVGAMVGVIIISMYLPMFKLLSLVK